MLPTIHMGNHHLRDFEQNIEMYNSEMIGFQNKNHLQQHQQNESASLVWKTFPGNNIYHGDIGPSSSNKAMNHEPSSTSEDQLYHHSMMVADDNDPSALRCMFSNVEGNGQGLSLSLRQQHHDDMRFVASSSSGADGLIFSNKNSFNNVQSQQHSMMQDGFLGKTALSYYNVSGQQFEIRNSKYLVPVQEILNEFCNIGTEQIYLTTKIKGQKNTDELVDDNSKKQSPLFSLDLLELQRRKARLLQMLEEVDRRYKHYCEQMKTVIAPFEAVAGYNAAKGYSVLASKAMSRHFRCLRDGILEQIKVTRKAMGEKDGVSPGTTKGETPRLKILDQTLRQEKAFQQMSIMESHPWRPQRGLPERSVSVLRAWLFEHFLHPYPSDVDKHILARQTGLSRSQVSNWFINARVRLWKPMVEEMYVEELKEQENNNVPDSMDGQTRADLQLDDESGNVNSSNIQNHHHNQLLINEDHKPTPDQLVRIDSECLSSIINTNLDKNKSESKNGKSILQESHHQLHKNNFNTGAMEFDFSQYNQHHTSTNEIHFGDNENAHHGHQQNYGGGLGNGNGISLTLGLQQHGGSGVSLAFSSPSHQSSLFYSRDHTIEDCQQVPQFSLLDNNHESQNLPYRNLMGAQLLHDLAG
ncbi:homeodomain transcription factor [Lithospermum erythrorhizon]|uniref:Homeodomain transcription factor n=1 Tax=Lithospermum erythrorhizon TaxID=34254 RepID=A0AAV3RJU0_LITER